MSDMTSPFNEIAWTQRELNDLLIGERYMFVTVVFCDEDSIYHSFGGSAELKKAPHIYK